jgi:hypothetical protein
MSNRWPPRSLTFVDAAATAQGHIDYNDVSASSTLAPPDRNLVLRGDVVVFTRTVPTGQHHHAGAGRQLGLALADAERSSAKWAMRCRTLATAYASADTAPDAAAGYAGPMRLLRHGGIRRNRRMERVRLRAPIRAHRTLPTVR